MARYICTSPGTIHPVLTGLEFSCDENRADQAVTSVYDVVVHVNGIRKDNASVEYWTTSPMFLVNSNGGDGDGLLPNTNYSGGKIRWNTNDYIDVVGLNGTTYSDYWVDGVDQNQRSYIYPSSLNGIFSDAPLDRSIRFRDFSKAKWKIIESGSANGGIIVDGMASSTFECIVMDPAAINVLGNWPSGGPRVVLSLENLAALKVSSATYPPDVAADDFFIPGGAITMQAGSWETGGWTVSNPDTLISEMKTWASKNVIKPSNFRMCYHHQKTYYSQNLVNTLYVYHQLP